MEESQNERWRELCLLASTEQDPAKLITLTKEINRLLDERDGRKQLSNKTSG